MSGGDDESKARGAAVGPLRRGGVSARTTRLGLWIAVVITVLFGDLSGRSLIAFVGLAALLFLLRTTPVDAIKLRRRNSDLLILTITSLLMPWRWSLVWVPLVTIALLFWLRLTRRSPWWAVVFAWNSAAVTAGWWAAGAVLIPMLGLTGLTVSAGYPKWAVFTGLFVDLFMFRQTRMKK